MKKSGSWLIIGGIGITIGGVALAKSRKAKAEQAKAELEIKEKLDKALLCISSDTEVAEKNAAFLAELKAIAAEEMQELFESMHCDLDSIVNDALGH